MDRHNLKPNNLADGLGQALLISPVWGEGWFDNFGRPSSLRT